MKTWVLFLISLILLIIGAGTRAASDRHAQTLAAGIIAADVANQPTTTLIANERNYVAKHMGANVSFELSNAYQQAQTAAQAAAVPQTNGSIYAQAQAACASIKIAVQQAQCNQNYLDSHLTQATTPTVTSPNVGDYSYHFISPTWTPDLTGLLWLGSVLGLLGVAARMIFRH